jgi:hypothetical protein
MVESATRICEGDDRCMWFVVVGGCREVEDAVEDLIWENEQRRSGSCFDRYRVEH